MEAYLGDHASTQRTVQMWTAQFLTGYLRIKEEEGEALGRSHHIKCCPPSEHHQTPISIRMLRERTKIPKTGLYWILTETQEGSCPQSFQRQKLTWTNCYWSRSFKAENEPLKLKKEEFQEFLKMQPQISKVPMCEMIMWWSRNKRSF